VTLCRSPPTPLKHGDRGLLGPRCRCGETALLPIAWLIRLAQFQNGQRLTLTQKEGGWAGKGTSRAMLGVKALPPAPRPKRFVGFGDVQGTFAGPSRCPWAMTKRAAGVGRRTPAGVPRCTLAKRTPKLLHRTTQPTSGSSPSCFEPGGSSQRRWQWACDSTGDVRALAPAGRLAARRVCVRPVSYVYCTGPTAGRRSRRPAGRMARP
jgi:hypothetical protein